MSTERTAPTDAGPAGTASTADPDPQGGHADHAGLAVLCEHLATLATTLPGPLGRVSLSLGAASVEVAWQQPAPVAAPAAEPRPAQPSPTAGTAAGTPPAPGAGPHLAAAPAPQGDAGHHQVTAPLVGTFYAAPSPGAPPFVAPGEVVEVGQTLGIVEAMKLMNPIVSDVAGRLVELLVADGQPVEFDQPLVLVETGAATSAGDTVLARVG